jgi:hypothetical protein
MKKVIVFAFFCGVLLALAGSIAAESQAAGVKHWHGAAANSPMTHLALTDPNGVQWLEKVSDEQYNGN